ncbi:MAG TPA: methyltransferase domain-containing protein [Gammaproteobacteria bacterium]|nr:methyltransferase domain-containing protein [Gammaproteobacteria bacterium]
MTSTYSDVVETARTYYNSDNADSFYSLVWGGEDIHIGTYQKQDDSIFEASRRTVQELAKLLSLDSHTKLLDIGSGYGGTARYLVKEYGCHVDCLNLSETQNQRNRDLNQAEGMADNITVIDGSFESIPAKDGVYDIVISQDAILHSGNRIQVFREVERVLKPSGEFLFTDPMEQGNCPKSVLQPVLDRIHLDSMGSFDFYIKTAESLGLETVQVVDLSDHLVAHYRRVGQEIDSKLEALLTVCSKEYIEKMKMGIGHWVTGGEAGHLTWGILHFKKPCPV